MNDSVIRSWRTNKATKEKMPSRKKALRGKSAKWPQLKERLVASVQEKGAEILSSQHLLSG